MRDIDKLRERFESRWRGILSIERNATTDGYSRAETAGKWQEAQDWYYQGVSDANETIIAKMRAEIAENIGERDE